MSYYQVTEWLSGAYRITSPEFVFIELIVGEEKALLFDTGWGTGNLRETVRGITDKPLIIVNSHGHVDHVNGNYQFEEEVCIHPKDIELCKAHSGTQMRQFVLTSVEGMGILPDGFDKDGYLSGGTGTLKPIEEGAVLDLGGKTMEIVELPGHTPGSIGLYYSEEKVLYVGDAINGALVLSLPEATKLATYIQTLEKAEKIDFRKMVQAHENRIFDKNILQTYIKLAKSVNWEKAQPYKDGDKENPDVRVMCVEGKTIEDKQDPDFACIVFTKDKL